ncbi:prepilin peptidase (plasmid) [Pantoea sp. App145]
MEWCYGLIAGLCAGSVINVIAYRLPQRLLNPDTGPDPFPSRSHCPGCKNILYWYDNIPLLSWLLLRGKCRHCHQSISIRYPVIELITALLSLVMCSLLPFTPLLLAALLLSWTLLTLSIIDIRDYLLPDALSLPLLWGGLLLHCFALLPGTLDAAVSGAVAGYTSLALLSLGYRKLRHTDALGMGDAKLLAALGAWLGWEPLSIVLIIACCGGLLFGLISRILWQRSFSRPIAFGPWLSLAGISLFINSII